jgi:transcriptional regulator with XRE-family HTH domain
MPHIVQNSSNGNNGSTALSGRGLPHRKLSLEERIGIAADLALRQCHIEPSKTQAAQLLGVTTFQLRAELKARAARSAQQWAAESEAHKARESIGARVRQARKQVGLTQVKLAERCGVAQATVQKIETGRSANSRFLPKIWVQLGLPLVELDPGFAQAQVGMGVEASAFAITTAWYRASVAAREQAIRTIGVANVWDTLARVID